MATDPSQFANLRAFLETRDEALTTYLFGSEEARTCRAPQKANPSRLSPTPETPSEPTPL